MKMKWIEEERIVPGVGLFRPGDVVEMEAAQAKEWEANGWAKPLKDVPAKLAIVNTEEK